MCNLTFSNRAKVKEFLTRVVNLPLPAVGETANWIVTCFSRIHWNNILFDKVVPAIQDKKALVVIYQEFYSGPGAGGDESSERHMIILVDKDWYYYSDNYERQSAGGEYFQKLTLNEVLKLFQGDLADNLALSWFGEMKGPLDHEYMEDHITRVAQVKAVVRR